MLGVAILALVALPAGPTSALQEADGVFTTVDGLPENGVHHIGEAHGTIWVGTRLGLVRLSQTAFASGDNTPPDLESAVITGIVTTTAGTLWVASEDGLFRRPPGATWSTAPSEIGINSASAIAVLGEEILVAGDGGVIRWRNGVIESFPSPGRVNAVALAPDGVAFAAAGNNLWLLENGELAKVDTDFIGGNVIGDITALSGEDIWLATTGGLVRINPRSPQSPAVIGGLGGTGTTSLSGDGSSRLWVGTNGGVTRLTDGAPDQLLTVADGLASLNVFSVFVDGEGNLWVGTDRGLSVLPVGSFEQENDLSRRSVTAVLVGPGGEALVGHSDGLMIRTGADDWAEVAEVAGRVNDLEGNPAEIAWIATESGLLKWDRGFVTVDPRVNSGLGVNAVVETTTELFVGTDGGLLVGTASGDLTPYPGDVGSINVQSMWEGELEVWVGTRNRGLYRIDEGGAELLTFDSTTYETPNGQVHGIPDNLVLAGALEDGNGNVMIGTAAGISRLEAGQDPTEGSSWTPFIEAPFDSSAVNTMTADVTAAGTPRVWIGTTDGLVVFVGDEFSVFTDADGLPSRNIQTLERGADGTIWIGTPRGLVYHRDAGRGPALEALIHDIDGRLCEMDCRTVDAAYSSKTAIVRAIATDIGDIGGVRYRFTVTEDMEVVRHPLQSDADLQLALRAGVEYQVSATAVDRDFNETELASPIFLRIGRKPWYVDWRWWVAIAVAAIPIIVLVALRVRRWRNRLGREEFTDVAIGFEASPEHADTYKVSIEIEHGKPFVEPSKLSVHRIVRLDESVGRSGSEATQGQLIDIGSRLWSMLPEAATQALATGLASGWVRLRMQFGRRGDAGRLPWETLYGGADLGHAVVGRLAVSRQPLGADDGATDRPPLIKPFRALIVSSNPVDRALLGDLEDEVGELEHALMQQGARVEHLASARIAELAEVMEDGWDLVHFIGHGGVKHGGGVLFFQDEDGDAESAGISQLGHLFERGHAAHGRAPRFVFLNACRSADPREVSGALSLAESLITEAGVGAVVGMGYPISTRAASAFATALYGNLIESGQIDQAITVARAHVRSVMGAERRDWAIPRLFMSGSSGDLFEFD